VTTTAHLERISGISNLKHTVQDIHDILKAYYTVVRKRFVDNVCMQATDYHLIFGPETLLKVFSPNFVGNLTSDQLEAIAEEDSTSIKRRRELHRQMESLRDGVKVLVIKLVKQDPHDKTSTKRHRKLVQKLANAAEASLAQ
jgi:hypothetical protein